MVRYIVKSKSGRVLAKGVCPSEENFDKVKEIYGGVDFTVEKIKNS